MAKMKTIAKETAKRTFLFNGSIRFMKNALSLKPFFKMFEHKKSKYYQEEQQNFDYWRYKLNYTPEILERNYKGNSILSYFYILFMAISVYSIILVGLQGASIAMFILFFALWHRAIFYAKCIKDFTMYKSFFCVFGKLDDICPNPFEPIKEKFSLIYDQEKKYLKK